MQTFTCCALRQAQKQRCERYRQDCRIKHGLGKGHAGNTYSRGGGCGGWGGGVLAPPGGGVGRGRRERSVSPMPPQGGASTPAPTGMMPQSLKLTLMRGCLHRPGELYHEFQILLCLGYSR